MPGRSAHPPRASLARYARRQVGPLAAPPWARAPFLLFRFPGLLIAIAGASLILAVAGASSPLFLSSASNATLSRGLATFCPWQLGLQVNATGPFSGRVDNPAFLYPSLPTRIGKISVPRTPYISVALLMQVREAALRQAAASIPNLGRTERTIVGPQGPIMSRSRQVGSVQLLWRDGFAAHIQKLSEAPGPGVWVPDTVAARLRLRAGDRVAFPLYPGESTGQPAGPQARVAGIYRDLSSSPTLPSFWCSQYSLIYPLNAFSNFQPPPLVLMDQPELVRLADQLQSQGNELTWEIPVRTERLTLTEAEATSAAIQQVELQLQSQSSGIGGYFDNSSRAELPGAVNNTTATVGGVKGPVETISLAARLVALLVMAAAGMYWVERRRVEVRVLATKGVGTLGLATKILLETLLPTAAAAAAGWFLAVRLMKALGPTSVLDPSAPRSALGAVIVTTAVALCLMALVAGIVARREGEPAHGRGLGGLARAPWEIAVLALAGASLYEILSRGTAPLANTSGAPPRVDALLLLFPILFLAGVAGLATRAMGRGLPTLRAAGSRAGHSLYLASRRLAAAPRPALALVTAVALAVGILAYAGILASSVTATSIAKARLFTGSDVSVAFASDHPVPSALARSATEVLRSAGEVTLPPPLGPSDVLGIDRATFARAAFWQRSFADQPLPNLLRSLGPGPPGSPIPIILVGGRIPPTGTLIFTGSKLAVVPYHVVAFARAFPRMEQTISLVVMDRSELVNRGIGLAYEIWAKGDPKAIDRAVRAAGLPVLSEVRASDVGTQPEFQLLSWVFGFLEALGVMTGLIALGGVLLYLQTRQQARQISYALARRMGLSRRSNLRSVRLELAGMLAAGLVLGIALAWIAARIIYEKLVPDATAPAARVVSNAARAVRDRRTGAPRSRLDRSPHGPAERGTSRRVPGDAPCLLTTWRARAPG